MSETDQRVTEDSQDRRELLRKLAAQARGKRNRIAPAPRPERIPLSSGQRRLWWLDQLFPGITAYNAPTVYWLRGDLNADALRTALQSLIDRHEVLRTVYLAQSGEPFQRILPTMPLRWDAIDARGDTPESRRDDALARARDAASQPFDLTRDASLRASLIRVEPDLHLLCMVYHHIAIDGWSMAMLSKQFVQAYNTVLDGGTPDITASELQIADVAIWQQEAVSGQALERQIDYWKERLEGAPAVLDLPTDRPRPAAQTFRGGSWSTRIPEPLYRKLENIGRERQSTMSMLVLTAFQILLSRYSNQDHVVIAAGSAGRTRLELENVVGFFINLLPLPLDLSDAPTFLDALDRTRDTMLASMDNGDAPLDKILERLRVPRSSSYTPFAQVMYFFQNYPRLDLGMTGISVDYPHLSQCRQPTAQADFTLFVNQHFEGELMFEYAVDLYDEPTIRRMGGHLLRLLEAIADAPTTIANDLPILSAEEHARLAEWNHTERALPEPATIAAQIAAQVARTPDATAVEFAGRRMSYRELDRRGNALAHALRAQGVGPGVLVGLYVERSLEMLVGLVGILKAGGAYVPLDPSYPAERLGYMVELSESPVLATQPSLRDALPSIVPAGMSPAVVVVDADAALGADADAPPDGASGENDPAYVIFTSGSTGKPKGVEIRQRSAVNLLRSIAREPGLTETDTICAISTLSFDIALSELVLPLTVGARILLVDRDTVRDVVRLRKLVDAEGITIMQATPATWRMLLDLGWTGKPGMRIISTGEALPRDLADRLLPCAPELWNLYGPTETTVYSALCRVEPGSGPIIVGRPVDNTVLRIVDKRMHPLPIGVPGELLIGGVGLAAGYRGRPDLTAEKFIADPFSDAPDARLYRTGDLALWREDGTVQVVGRLDHQIKLRGFRIELGEIESVLGEFPGVTQAVVHCREDRPGDRYLAAYFTHDGAAPDESALRAHLKNALPEYMVPGAFVRLDAFPLTPNGKVDRRALPAPQVGGAPGDGGDFQGPRTAEEQALAELWCELLALPRVDVRANFFDLGGHSLLGTRMLARIEDEFGVELPLRTLFDTPVLERLAARVAEAIEELDAEFGDFDDLSDEELRQRLERGTSVE
ncbi:MAG: amino acid adenylation domain-containing protein [Lysobacter sp.]|nr:amino acid adenylation domain-containing protein [Lysobacter sp.]